MLRFLVAQLHLNQHRQLLAQRGRGSIQPLCNLQRVHRIDRIEQLGCFIRLVRLQRSDQMESRIGQCAEVLRLLLKLLHAVFAKEALTRRIGLQNDFDWMDLADGHQRNFALPATASTACRGNLFVQAGEIVGDGHDSVLSAVLFQILLYFERGHAA